MLLPLGFRYSRVLCDLLSQLGLESPVLETAAHLGRLTNAQHTQVTTTYSKKVTGQQVHGSHDTECTLILPLI